MTDGELLAAAKRLKRKFSGAAISWGPAQRDAAAIARAFPALLAERDRLRAACEAVAEHNHDNCDGLTVEECLNSVREIALAALSPT